MNKRNYEQTIKPSQACRPKENQGEKPICFCLLHHRPHGKKWKTFVFNQHVDFEVDVLIFKIMTERIGMNNFYRHNSSIMSFLNDAEPFFYRCSHRFLEIATQSICK